MRRFTGLLTALLLALLTLFGLPNGARAAGRRGMPSGMPAGTAHHRREPGAPGGSVHGGSVPGACGPERPRHPHFPVVRHELKLVEAPSHRPVPPIRPQPPSPVLDTLDDSDGLFSSADVDTDTDEGVFTAVSYRYQLASDTRELDLPLGVDAHPQAPVAWPRSPRGPPVA